MAQQHHVRPEDHLYRRRVMLRMDLQEKINRPILGVSGMYMEGTDGLVQALVEGLQDGEYLAYEPDDLSRALSYDDVLERVRGFDDEGMPVFSDADWLEEAEGFIAPPEDSWFDTDTADLTGSLGTTTVATTPDLSNCEETIQVVEDWIFDKNRGEMLHRPKYIELIWTDPNGALPEKKVAVLRFEDVAERLEKTTWNNRFNDAEARNLLEIFSIKLYHAFVIDVSGRGVRSLAESKRRMDALVEWEQYVWSL